MKGNEIDFKSKELDKKRLMGLEICQDGVKKANPLE
jgi:hypothetical protein